MMKIDLRDPRKQRLILLSLGLLAAAYYFFFSDVASFTYQARGKELAELRGERDRLNQEISRARAGANRLEDLDRQRDALAHRWLEMEAALPASFDSPAFLANVTRIGHQENLEFLLMEPKAFRSQEYYQVAPVQVRVEGGYHDLGRFLADLDNLTQIVRVSSLKMSANPRAGDKGTEQEEEYVPPVVAEMEVSTCFLGEGSVPATPETTGKKSVSSKSTSSEPKATGPRAAKKVAKATAATVRGEGER